MLTYGGWFFVAHFGFELLQKSRFIRFRESYISAWNGHLVSRGVVTEE